VRIAHLAWSDTSGGAAIAAHRLHRGLRRISVDSRMLVAEKRCLDETVQVAARGQKMSERLRCRIRSKVISRDFARYRTTRPAHLERFSDDRAWEPNLLPDFLPKADLYNLHWVAGFLDYRTFFTRVPRDVPLVWTLHDMNPFTGGCHYTAGCERFVAACGACPALGSTDSKDLSAEIFRRKCAAYARLNPERVRVVAPSVWLSREASRSALLGKFDISTIPYGLDTEIFQPRGRGIAREVFGIPQDLRVVMFVAHSFQSHRKGLDLLVAALTQRNVSSDIGLISVGTNELSAAMPGGCCYALGELNNERLMSFAYSAADLFVLPAREDNLPNVVLEAMACGTPVVAFDVGGLPDMVRPDVTGLLVPADNVQALRASIETLFNDKERLARMSRECRRVAIEEYGLELQAERYRQVYEELLAATRVADPNAMRRRPSSENVHALSDTG
jgi:glycosyltransferase involved in cell wall biosynthesis